MIVGQHAKRWKSSRARSTLRHRFGPPIASVHHVARLARVITGSTLMNAMSFCETPTMLCYPCQERRHLLGQCGKLV